MNRRHLLKTMGGASIAIAFATVCRTDGTTSEVPLDPTSTPTISPISLQTAPSSPPLTVSATVGTESAFTKAPAGTNPFDNYTYENTATGTRVRIYLDGGTRYIDANGLPDHSTGTFPSAGNPNAITEQSYALQVPGSPAVATPRTNVLGHWGIAINGIPFAPGVAEFWDNDFASGWQEEALTLSGSGRLGIDDNQAHVQPTGAYHYHGAPDALVLGQSGDHSPLVGFAADGFPVYIHTGYADSTNGSSAIAALDPSYRLRSGTRPDGPGGTFDGSFVADYEYVHGLGDLDEHNGRLGVTPEYPNGTYYYVLTNAFPFIPRSFRGTRDSSFGMSLTQEDVAAGLGGPPQNGGRPPGDDSVPRRDGTRPPDGRTRPPRPR
jgi:hypothetical protein